MGKKEHEKANNDSTFINIRSGDISVLLDSEWWEGKSDFEIVEKQIHIKDLAMICDFDVFKTALENVLGRPVAKSEFAKPEMLLEEFENKYYN